MAKAWGTEDIGDLSGRVAVVTGGNRGLGFASAAELARWGASVVLACRDVERGAAAAERIRGQTADAEVSVVSLDLAADAGEFERFGEEFAGRHGRLDILLNNAALVNLETLQRAESGIEMQMAVNHFGHFALFCAVADVMAGTSGARVVTVSSVSYRHGSLDFDDLGWQTRDYRRQASYGASKLANLLFTAELQRRFEATGAVAISVAAHPGLTGTERQQSEGVGGRLSSWLATPVAKGVRHQLFAATHPSVQGGEFYGPRYGLWGRPTRQQIKPPVDPEKARRLWDLSEQITEFRYPR